MKYYVYYNAELIAEYKTMQSALRFIKRKGLDDDDDNFLLVIDEDGNTYSPVDGERIEIE